MRTGPAARRTGTLVVGASQAGVQLVTSLRELGDTGAITLVGAEAHAPYQRPPLSKELLAGSGGHADVAFRTEGWYADQRVDLVCGNRVVAVRWADDADHSRGGVATTGSGDEIAFERLALTTGARPRRLTVPGADLSGISYLRDLDDALRLRDHLASARRVVVVGGGFIGLEAVAAARVAGARTVVVEAGDRLVGRSVAPVVSEYLRRAHERRGAEVLLRAEVVGFGGTDGRVRTVLLSDGRELEADLVVVGIGVVPRTELAEQLGLACDGGVVVDGHGRTAEPAVVAAGDCTTRPNPLTGTGLVRLESVPSAVAQATLAAGALLGREGDPRSVPWFWSNQGDLKMQMVGLSAGSDHHVLRGDPDRDAFSVLYYRAGELIAADAVNTPLDYLVVRKALTLGVTLPADLAADGSQPLKALLAARTAPVTATA